MITLPNALNDFTKNSCETIHICIVCSGLDTARTVVTLLKSILFYRKNPLVFHFISDESARNSLSHLATTWRISHVEFKFYAAEPVLADVAWIPNKHYSGVYGLLKLTLPKILPVWLERVIVLDTDVVLATDIAKLWQLFSKFGEDKSLCLGLVENQSDWYIPGTIWTNHRPWPALGRGYNTGVILMDLARLRDINWHTMWRTVAEHNLMTLLSTSLADQDIINTLIKRHPSLVVNLPCSWNIQLSEHSLYQQLCQDKTKEVNIIHFNSPEKKVLRLNKSFKYFQNLLETFQQLDGSLVQDAIIRNCVDPTRPAESSTSTEIQNIPPGNIDNYITEVTFVATLSNDRMHALEGLLTAWSGPISLALYLTDAEAARFTQLYQSSPLMKNRRNVGYHIVYKENWFYPVNYLRNVAKKEATTDYIFLCDIDFLPSEDMEVKLSEYVHLLEENSATKNVLVVPAFESERYRIDLLPNNKADLLKQLDVGEIIRHCIEIFNKEFLNEINAKDDETKIP